MTRPTQTLTGLTLALALALPAGAAAGEGRLLAPNARARWSEQELATARPMPIPQVDLSHARTLSPAEAAERLGGRSWESPAGEPSGRGPLELEHLVIDRRRHPARRFPERPGRWRPRWAADPSGGLVAANRGRADLDFSSSRLVPTDARLVFPYSTVGKLFLRDGASRYVCSASVVSARVVLTAGHCVFGADGFFTDFMFVPAYHDGNDPFGTWEADFVTTTEEWENGGDVVPSDADFGFLVMADQDGMRIGNVTGWLGWKTGSARPNHIHSFGYPVDLDRGDKMHQVASGSSELLEIFGTTTVLYGSDMRGGASGGPWVQNFGVRAKGQRGGDNRKMNRVVGVNSFVSNSTSFKEMGGSIPGRSFREEFNRACNQAPGNCAKKGKPKG